MRPVRAVGVAAATLAVVAAAGCRKATTPTTRPGGGGAVMQQADAAFDRGHFAEAADLYAQADATGQPDAREQLAYCLAAIGQWERFDALTQSAAPHSRLALLYQAGAIYRGQLSGAAGTDALAIGPMADGLALIRGRPTMLPPTQPRSMTPVELVAFTRAWADAAEVDDSVAGRRQWLTMWIVRRPVSPRDLPAASGAWMRYRLDAAEWVVQSAAAAVDPTQPPADPVLLIDHSTQAVLVAAVREGPDGPWLRRLWVAGTLQDDQVQLRACGEDAGAGTTLAPWAIPTSLPAPDGADVTGPGYP